MAREMGALLSITRLHSSRASTDQSLDLETISAYLAMSSHRRFCSAAGSDPGLPGFGWKLLATVYTNQSTTMTKS